jgi:hypothetical protein
MIGHIKVYRARYGTTKWLSVTASAQFDWSSYFSTFIAYVHTVPDRSHEAYYTCIEAYCPVALKPTVPWHWSLLSFYTVAYYSVALKPIVLLHWSLLSCCTEAYCPFTLKPIVLLHWSLLSCCTEAYCPFTLKPIVLLHWHLLSCYTEAYCPFTLKPIVVLHKPIVLLHWSLLSCCTEAYCPVAPNPVFLLHWLAILRIIVLSVIVPPIWHLAVLRSAYTLYLCVLFGSGNKRLGLFKKKETKDKRGRKVARECYGILWHGWVSEWMSHALIFCEVWVKSEERFYHPELSGT